ncbi:MAG: hypothetical protein ACTSPQ_20150 [Candidatus Helarchaeota archaeon]
MNKIKLIVGVVLFLFAGLLVTFFSKTSFVQYSYGAACYYCGWHNQYQMYECRLYEGPGYSGCEAQGTHCQGTGSCGIEI